MGKLLIGLGVLVLALIVAFVLWARWAGRWTSEVAAPPPAPASVPQVSGTAGTPGTPGTVSLAQARIEQQRAAAAAIAAASAPAASSDAPAPTIGNAGRCEDLLRAGARLGVWLRGSGPAPEAVLVVREPRPDAEKGDRGDFTAALTQAGTVAQEPVRGRWSGERFFLTRMATPATAGPQQWEGRCQSDGTIRGRWTSAADGEAGTFRLAPP
jgi:hypothetical protein